MLKPPIPNKLLLFIWFPINKYYPFFADLSTANKIVLIPPSQKCGGFSMHQSKWIERKMPNDKATETKNATVGFVLLFSLTEKA